VILALIVIAIVGIALFVTQPVFVRSGPALPLDPLTDRLQAHVEKLARELAPRGLSHPANLDAAAAYVRQAWTDLRIPVEEQRYRAEGHSVCNVIGRIGPGGGERIVVGAHYDSYGAMPGADDNASGTAGLIELARLLQPRSLAMGVELVAFTLEEPPEFGSETMGSAVHVESLQRDGVRVRAMLCLEMIGCFSDRSGSQSFPAPAMGLLYPRRGNFIAVAGRFADRSLIRRVKRSMTAATNLPVRSICAPSSFGGIDLSDHVNYWRAGIPAVLITDTAFFRNSRYHTPEDTPETLDYLRMADVVVEVADAVTELAGGGVKEK
jgi:hypothetical protein